MPATSDFSTDTEFRAAVVAVLDSLVDQVDALDFDAVDDLDIRLTPGNLHVTFEPIGGAGSGAVFVLSQQTPTHELWLSANLTAWHFVQTGGLWRERDSGEAMQAVLERLFSEKLGGPVTLSV
jgi:iron donor protein CyaY